jgi:peptide/nickel transport system substrate-binding protein
MEVDLGMSRGGTLATVGLALLALVGIALIAGAPDWRVPADADLDDPESRRSYVTAIFEDITARNPWSRFGPDTTVWNSYVAVNAHQTLFTYTTQRFDWVPQLAADFPDALEHDPETGLWRSRVRLKEGVSWSDGTPVTAHDVAFTFEAIAAFGAHELGGNFPTHAPPDLLQRVVAIDDHTVEFFLTRRDARFNFGILLAPVFQRGYWEPHVAAALESPDPLAAIFEVDVIDEPISGPFLYGTWERGSFVNRPVNRRFSLRGARERLYAEGAVRLARDGLYDWTAYGEPASEPVLEVTTGPHVESVHYRVYGTQATGVLALQAGQVDYLFNPLGLERGFQDQLRDVPGVTLIENATNGIRYLAFNLRREPMSRLAFRQAVATLIDREFVTDRVLQGVAEPLYSVVPPGNAAWHNPDVPVYGRGLSRGDRVREAVRLLEADGFTWAQRPVVDAAGTLVTPGRGLRLPNGQPVAPLELLGPGEAYDPLRATFASWTERWLNEAGIPVRPVLTAFNAVSDRVFDRQDFDMYILGWSLTVYPSYLESFFSSRYTGLRGHNAAGYANPEYDRLVDEFLSEADDMARAREAAFRLQEFLARDLPYVVLFDTPIVEAYRSDHIRFPTTETLGGIQNSTFGGPVGFTHAVQLVR